VTRTLNDDGRPTSPERISERISETLQLSEAPFQTFNARHQPLVVQALRDASRAR
jgi:hypothetical protein